MITDLSKSSIEQLLDLIRSENELSPVELNDNDISFNDINALEDDPSGKNTTVVLGSKPNTRYVGSVSIKYDRLPLSGLSQYGELTIIVTEDSTDLDILNAVNSAYGTNISFDEITISNSELVDYDGDYVTFTATLSSLVWLGDITLFVKYSQTLLSAILVNNELDGLNWPIIPVIQQITFNQPSNQEITANPIITATSDSGLTPVITSLTPAVCTIDEEGEVSFSTVGTCSLAANQAGNEYYLPADQVVRNFQVLPVVPDAPTNVVATPTVQGASVTMTPPVFNGGSVITGYGAISTPGNVVVEGSSLPLIFTGLSPSTQYTFEGYVYNVVGDSPLSAASSPITPEPPEVGEILTGTSTQRTDIAVNSFGGYGGIIDGILYLRTGGASSQGGTPNGNLLRYNISTNTWLSNAAALPNWFRDSGAIVHGGKLYVFGGAGSANTVSQSNWCYDPVANTWVSKLSIPFLTVKPAVASVGNYIYVYGGGGSGEDGRKLYRYDPDANTWTSLLSSPAGGGNQFGMIHRNGKLYAFASTTDSTLVRIYDIATNTWSTSTVTDRNIMTGGSWATSAVFRNTLYLFGNGGVWYFNLETLTIIKLGSVNFGTEVTALAGSNGIYVAGGTVDANGLYLLT